MEEWRSVTGWEGIYSVSSLGRCRSENRVIIRKNGAPQTIKERIFTGCANELGYLKTSLRRGTERRLAYLHRLVAEAFIPNPDNKCDVNHINGVTNDNRVENLEWATRKENHQHASKVLGCWWGNLQGEKSNCVVLTNDLVMEIRRRYARGGTSYKRLAEEYGVHKSTINCIITRRTWKHI